MRNVTSELLFIGVSGGIAALIGLGTLVDVIRDRRRPAAVRAPLGGAVETSPPIPAPSHEAVVRVVWWVAIAGLLVGIGLSDAYPSHRSAIFGVGGAAALVVVLMH